MQESTKRHKQQTTQTYTELVNCSTSLNRRVVQRCFGQKMSMITKACDFLASDQRSSDSQSNQYCLN